MERYISEELGISFDIDKNQFGDLEIVSALAQLKEYQQNPLLCMGVGGSIFYGPIIYKNVLYFGSCDKNLYAVSTEGGLLWKFEANDPICGAPCAAEGVVYFSSFDRNLYALDAETKEIVWKFATNGKIFSTPFIHNGVVYFGSEDQNLYAVDAKTGNLVWRFETGGAITSYPIVYKDAVYIGSTDNNFYAISLDGKLLWKFSTNGAIRHGFSAGNGIVYFGSMDGKVYGVNAQGKKVFEFKTKDAIGNSIAFFDGTVYFGSRDNNFYAVREDGTLLWKVKLNDMAEAGTFYKGVVYTGGCDNILRAIDNKTGRVLWEFKTNGIVVGIPLVVNDIIYFGSWDCNLYAIDINGKLLWKFPTSLSHQAPIHLPPPEASKTAEIIWQPVAEEKKEEGTIESNINEYGEFRGAYTGEMKTDYISSRKKGYIH